MAVARRPAAVGTVALALMAAGCGGDDGEDLTSEDALRDCLTEQGLTLEASDLGSSAGLGNASPDFQVISGEGEIADIVVEGSERKAARTAADIKGAKASFGVGQTVVVRQRNAVAVFEDQPPAEFRLQVETCIG